MDLSRRDALKVGGGVVAGAVGALGAVAGKGRLDEGTPLPFYGSAVSGIRPDRSAPGAASASVVWAGPATSRRVALTFDDGPHPEWTPRVLEALDRAGVPGTFFCTGRNVRDHGSIHRDSVGRHELANHTFEHPDLGRFPLDRCRDEIGRTSAALADAYGVTPTLFRPPYGHLGGATLLAAAEAGLTVVLWSAQPREELFREQPDGIVTDVAAAVRPGSIVLGHDTGSADRLPTIERLPRLIATLRDDGYTLVTVSELLHPRD
ncbi:MAG TPA: polysaccharide deacetylase family protein [Intrasporangium sp.]|uniref:polysaccharide deacetylase family protein n=1 Tax=Intrasporangium sp. TaxID=1925024 RepID=UPI002D765DD1|nr:polysaccharide deacetylase family protein [Intrasporangium sp.]HET7399207.1 polysaccharide deacetylase family protein [Intrasporangium sp.]